MAAINDLIAQITDEGLRKRLEQEVNKLSKQKKFGLVFESHLLEVLRAICVARGYSLEELEALRAKKADERGGFAEKIFLEFVEKK